MRKFLKVQKYKHNLPLIQSVGTNQYTQTLKRKCNGYLKMEAKTLFDATQECNGNKDCTTFWQENCKGNTYLRCISSGITKSYHSCVYTKGRYNIVFRSQWKFNKSIILI